MSEPNEGNRQDTTSGQTKPTELTAPAMLLHAVGFVVAIVVLAKVADPLVASAIEIGRRLRLPSALVGATLLAFATSAPELGTRVASLVTAFLDPRAAQGGVGDIGVATILGSAAFNVAVVLAVVGFLVPGRFETKVLRRDGGGYAVALVLLIGMFLMGRPTNAIARLEAAGLVFFYVGFVALTLRRERGRAEPSDASGPSRPWLRMLLGIGLIYAAAHVLVTTLHVLAIATAEALALGVVSVQTHLSLVVVAAASSVPELFASVSAARRGKVSMAVSSALGSNTFDLSIGLGVPYLALGPRPIHNGVVAAALGVLMVLVWAVLVLRSGNLRRAQAWGLVLGYGLLLGLLVTVFVHGRSADGARRTDGVFSSSSPATTERRRTPER